MISRFVRNLPTGASLLALAILVLATATAGDASAAETRSFVDGNGMAATDNMEDPHQGGGGSMEGDPWGGEQRDAGDVDHDGPVIVETHATTAESTRWTFRFADLWSLLTAFWASLLR